MQYDCPAESTVFAESYIATDTAYQYNVGSATGVAKDINFLDIGASFRQRQFEPNHSSWNRHVFSTGVIFMLILFQKRAKSQCLLSK